MSKTREMVEALESFVIQKVQSFNEETNPGEVVALAELVKAINAVPMPFSYISEVGTVTGCAMNEGLTKLSERVDSTTLGGEKDE